MTTPNTARTVRAAVILAAVIALPACDAARKHGKYTTEGKSAAQARMDSMKAATEYQIALQALLAGNRDKALKHVDRSLSLTDKIARAWVLRGRVMLERGQLEESSLSFDKAAELEPKNAEVPYYRGVLAERVQRKEDALLAYTEAARLDPLRPQYALAAAEMMIDMERLEEAKAFLKERQRDFSHTPGIPQALGHIAMIQGDYAEAIKQFSEARLLAPDEFEALEDLARAQYMGGSFAEAEANLARLARSEAFRDRRDLAQMRARCLVNMERFAEARDVLLALTSDEAGAADADLWIELGQVAYQLRDMSRLRDAFNRTLAIAPNRAEGHVLKGLYQRRIGRNAEAAETFRRAAELDPSADNYVLLGVTLNDLGKAQVAQEAFRRAAAIDPDNETARKLAGVSN
ncbi:MAG TPA: tetratricopeptide repeat protein [Phycisphaerales bacterium]|nr:tetratricopeptide repeat protein [Phycisphaerales bacterium]